MARILDKKLKKVLEMRTDSPEFIDSLNALSTFYGQGGTGNTLEARRGLRSDLETRSLALARRLRRAPLVHPYSPLPCSSVRRIHVLTRSTSAFLAPSAPTLALATQTTASASATSRRLPAPPHRLGTGTRDVGG